MVAAQTITIDTAIVPQIATENGVDTLK